MSLDILYSSVERPTVTLMTYNKNGFECLSKSINQYADMENVEGVNFALLLYSSYDVEWTSRFRTSRPPVHSFLTRQA